MKFLFDNKSQISLMLFLIALMIFGFGCNFKKNNSKQIDCKETFKKFFLEKVKSGEGIVDLETFNCVKWDKMIIIEPYFNVKELAEITNSELPSEMNAERSNENIYHLLFIDENDIILYLPISSFQVNFSELVSGKKCYKTVLKRDYSIAFFKSDEQIYNSEKFVIKAKLLKK